MPSSPLGVYKPLILYSLLSISSFQTLTDLLNPTNGDLRIRENTEVGTCTYSGFCRSWLNTSTPFNLPPSPPPPNSETVGALSLKYSVCLVKWQYMYMYMYLYKFCFGWSFFKQCRATLSVQLCFSYVHVVEVL